MERSSNCCGARIDGLNASGIGRCSECKEGCGVEEVGRKIRLGLWKNPSDKTSSLWVQLNDKEIHTLSIEDDMGEEYFEIDEKEMLKLIETSLSDEEDKIHSECKEGCGVEEVKKKEGLPYTRTDRIIDALLAIKEIGLLTPGEGEEDIDFLEEKINEIIDKFSEKKQ